MQNPLWKEIILNIEKIPEISNKNNTRMKTKTNHALSMKTKTKHELPKTEIKIFKCINYPHQVVTSQFQF